MTNPKESDMNENYDGFDAELACATQRIAKLEAALAAERLGRHRALQEAANLLNELLTPHAVVGRKQEE